MTIISQGQEYVLYLSSTIMPIQMGINIRHEDGVFEHVINVIWLVWYDDMMTRSVFSSTYLALRHSSDSLWTDYSFDFIVNSGTERARQTWPKLDHIRQKSNWQIWTFLFEKNTTKIRCTFQACSTSWKYCLLFLNCSFITLNTRWYGLGDLHVISHGMMFLNAHKRKPMMLLCPKTTVDVTD